MMVKRATDEEETRINGRRSDRLIARNMQMAGKQTRHQTTRLRSVVSCRFVKFFLQAVHWPQESKLGANPLGTSKEALGFS